MTSTTSAPVKSESSGAWTGTQKLRAWAVLSGVVLVILQSNISRTGTEGWDFAANSILIQQAKHFRLFTGHYSRVGFNHPGPVLLYMQALGEWFFHDFLHLTTPVGGQLAMNAFYCAGWLVTIASLVRLVAPSGLEAIAFTAFAAAVFAFANSDILAGLWFPDMFVLPFATFVVAVSIALLGFDRAHLPLVVSIVVLVHGHVAFVPITGIVLSCALVLHLSGRSTGRGTRDTSTNTRLQVNRRTLALSAALTIAVVSPIVVETLRRSPGPIREYLSYSDAAHSHSVSSALSFVLRFVGGGAIALTGAMVLVGSLHLGLVPESFRPFYKTLCLVVGASAMAGVVYALWGIDYLGLTYTGYFLYSLGALPIALVLVSVLKTICRSQRCRQAVLATLVVVSSASASAAIHKPQSFTRDAYFNFPYTQEIVSWLKHNRRPFVLDLADDNATRLYITSALAEYLRHNSLRFCVRQNWNIMFSRELRCAPSLKSDRDHFYVAADGQTEPRNLRLVTKIGPINFYRMPAEVPAESRDQTNPIEADRAA